MTIPEKIEQYKLLKKSKRTLEKRLRELRQDISTWIPSAGSYCGLQLQVRDLTTYDENKVHQLMDSKGIARRKYCNVIVAPDAIEELYLDGTLTDSDLREIRKPKYTYALIEVGDADVQVQNEGSG